MRRIHNVISGALKIDVRGGLITPNPAHDADLPDAVRPTASTADQRR
jgi:hypothetical protein